MDTWKTIRVFNEYITANIVRAKLEDMGITCFLKDVNVTTVWGAAASRIQLMVPESEVEKAEELLVYDEEEAKKQSETIGFYDDDLEQLDENNRVCIYCGSKNTRRVDDDKDSALMRGLNKLFGKNNHSEKWHCFHCGKKF